jgi:CHASE2 domain-containing sensor protein
MVVDGLHAAGAKTVVLDVFLGFAGSPDEQAMLAPSLAHTVTAVTFDPSDGRAPTGDELRAALVAAPGGPEVGADSLSFPPERIVAAVARLGHSGFVEGGSVRSSPPLVRIRGFDGALPSQPLAALIVHRELLGWNRPPATLVHGSQLLDLVPGGTRPPDVSVADLLAGKIAARSLKGALAVVHVDTPEDRHPSPLGPATPGGLLLASAIRTLDGGRSPRLFPAWVAILLCAAMGFVALQLPNARARLIACAVFEAGWLATAFALVPVADLFLPILGPMIAFAGAILASTRNGRTESISDSASGNGGRGARS